MTAKRFTRTDVTGKPTTVVMEGVTVYGALVVEWECSRPGCGIRFVGLEDLVRGMAYQHEIRHQDDATFAKIEATWLTGGELHVNDLVELLKRNRTLVYTDAEIDEFSDSKQELSWPDHLPSQVEVLDVGKGICRRKLV